MSVEWKTTEAEDDMSSADTTLKGSGLRLFSFTNLGLYFGAGLSYVMSDSEAGDYEYCDYGSDCISSLSSVATSFVEISRSWVIGLPLSGCPSLDRKLI